MTTNAGPSNLAPQYRPHCRKTSICAANAHGLLQSDEVAHFDTSPTTSTLSGVSNTTHYLPASPANVAPFPGARRGTIGSLTSNKSAHSSSPSSNATVVGNGAGNGVPNGVLNGAPNGVPNGTHPSTSSSLSHGLPRTSSRARTLSQSQSHSYLPHRGSIPSPTPGTHHSPIFHSPSITPNPPQQQIMQAASTPPPPIAFATLMLLGNDRIRISGFPESCQELVRHVLSNGWKGVEAKRSPGKGVFEWKLARTPWMADAPLAAYRLIEYILFSLSKEGWALAMSAGMPNKHNTRETFFFMPAPRRERRFFSILFGTHMVTLLDAPDQRVCEAFVQALATWPAGAGALYSREHGALAINMKKLGDGDAAWPTSGGKFEHALPQLMCMVLQNMARIGYECVTTYDILDRATGWHWNDAKGIVNGAMPAIDVWVFAQR